MGASKNTSSTNASNKKWWIPINFATRTNPDFSSTLPTHWLSPKDEVLVIEGVDPLDWIIVNIQQTGFYRVDYDEIKLLKIADYMYSENYQKILVLNRAQIIDSAISLMLSNKMNPLRFMEITKYLRNETDLSAWYPILKFMKEAKRFSFVCNESGEMLKVLHDNPDEDYFTRITRNEILEEACAFDHSVCLRKARVQLMTYLENNTFTNSLHFETSFHKKMWMFCNGVKQANETVWNKLLKQEENKDFLLTFCFGYSKNLILSERFLNTMLKNDSVIRKEEVHRIMYSVLNADFPLYIDAMLNFTISYWNKLVTIFDDPTNLLRDISWNVASRGQVHEVKNVGIDVPQSLKLQEKNIK